MLYLGGLSLLSKYFSLVFSTEQVINGGNLFSCPPFFTTGKKKSLSFKVLFQFISKTQPPPSKHDDIPPMFPNGTRGLLEQLCPFLPCWEGSQHRTPMGRISSVPLHSRERPPPSTPSHYSTLPEHWLISKSSHYKHLFLYFTAI